VAGLLPPYGIASSLGAYNRVAARWGVEIADPWADRRVVEFCLRLPLEWKFRGGWTKFIVRRAFEGELPASVTRRIGKQHVGWQLVNRLMCDSRDRAESALEGELACVDNFVEPGAARRLIRRYLSGGDYVDCANSLEVLTLIAWVKACANNRPE
jgi:asparagine synthase (glutamine-hydrolysing)